MMASVQTRGFRDFPVGTLPRPVQLSAAPTDSFVPRPLVKRSLFVSPSPLPPLGREGVKPVVDTPQSPLTVRGVTFQPMSLAELRPGDIGVDYRAEKRNLRQKIIAAGEGLQDLFRRNRRGSPSFMHAFLVLQTYPGLGKVRVADASIEGKPEDVAAGLNSWGLGSMDLELAECQIKHGFHVFFRFKDPRMGLRMASIARNWAARYGGNFRFFNAIRSVWRKGQMDQPTLARLLHLSKSAHVQGPMLESDGSPYQVMCSEFVGLVAACAAMSLYVDDHPGVHSGDPETLRALAEGPAGTLCQVDPASLSPSALAGRLGMDDGVMKVGHIYAES